MIISLSEKANQRPTLRVLNGGFHLYQSNRSGFTLIELTLVLLLASILAAVAVPRWTTALQSFRVANAAHRVAADLALAKATAYSSSASRTVTFSVSNNQYTVGGVKSLNRASGPYVVVLSTDPYRSQFVSVWGQTSEQTITFDGFGKPNRGGTIVVASGGCQKSIVVDAESGVAVVP